MLKETFNDGIQQENVPLSKAHQPCESASAARDVLRVSCELLVLEACFCTCLFVWVYTALCTHRNSTIQYRACDGVCLNVSNEEGMAGLPSLCCAPLTSSSFQTPMLLGACPCCVVCFDKERLHHMNATVLRSNAEVSTCVTLAGVGYGTGRD